jgi:hypothetical protein
VVSVKFRSNPLLVSVILYIIMVGYSGEVAADIQVPPVLNNRSYDMGYHIGYITGYQTGKADTLSNVTSNTTQLLNEVLPMRNKTANNTSLGATINAFFNTSGDILFSFIRIIFGVLILVLLFMLARWFKRDDYEILVLPFEIIKSGDKYNGNAIANLLIAELQRITQINGTKYEGIENEKLSIPPQILSGETASIPQLGTISTGSASISIGEMMITIKQLFRGGNRGKSVKIITGCLEDCGSKIKLIACSRGDKPCTCEAQKKTDIEIKRNSSDDFDISKNGNKENTSISDLVRDLSFEIAYTLSKESISAKTSLGFKHFTEALANYQ